MVQHLKPNPAIIYPDSDGQPMSDNTKQFRWIVVIKENLELLFADRPDVFVAGDLLWYPVEGDNKIRQAPDAMVIFGRPKGDRGSYRQWEEDNITPQVVFEIVSPGDRLRKMFNKFKFYEHYGVEEYYVYDPDTHELIGWLRSGNVFEVVEEMNGWVSPRLEIRFQLTSDTLEIYHPNGQRFLTFVEIAQLREQETQRAEQERQRAEREQRRAERLAEQLRALGVEPDEGE
ncbi:Uma2 family endonuclease [Kamptonema cortianum]|uniref:Uma2 family endonuclease n=1 Tax=Geitlerinema calcuttense NRMC-F 0142 TaxID=2922238 RepID=A0ABT7LW79_9CYAN|nr:Uma2 family endonuclease [Geitlerinema calcuttense]MCD8487390.1 Uma2 family endonuclease [Desertifilum sp.]MDK3159191.1 Uma2 family endonuclease [Kamptonema cortianum]MDL5056293.1 Uma2 family endonuclease [Geitlerinema calcuttense NRMC-F 0142]